MISNVGNTLLSSPMHRLECLNVIDEIIDGMDDKGILELMQGSGGDLDWVLDNLMKDTYQVMYTGDPNIDFAPKYTERLSQSIEETLRVKNLAYFITSVLPDFQTQSCLKISVASFSTMGNDACNSSGTLTGLPLAMSINTHCVSASANRVFAAVFQKT